MDELKNESIGSEPVEMNQYETLREILDEKIYNQWIHALEITEREMRIAHETKAESYE